MVCSLGIAKRGPCLCKGAISMIRRALLMLVVLSLIFGTMVSATHISQNQNQQQNQDQQQQQDQQQNQAQDQNQHQSNYQNVNVIVPEEKEIKTLDVGPVAFTRLLWKDEVVTMPLSGVSLITIKAGSPLAVYTVDSHGEIFKVDSMDSIPVYDWNYHRFQFGSVSPIDKIPYYTTKGSLVSSWNADYVVVDNRNPFSGYNLVDVSIERFRWAGEP